MTFSTLTQSGSGQSIQVENESMCALIGGLSPAGAAQTMVVTRELISNIVVASTVAATLAALNGPIPASVLFTQADGVLLCRIMKGGIDEILPSGTANSKVILLDGTVVYVVGTPSVVAAAMGPTPRAGASRIVLEAFINANGTILAQQSDYGISLAFNPAYIANSANYTLGMTGASVPAGYEILTTQVSGEPCSFVSRVTAPGAATFIVSPFACSRLRGGGRTNTGGTLQGGNFGIASVVKNATGDYTVTASVTTRPSVLQVTPGEATPIIATVTTTSDGVFAVRTFDEDGVAADSALNLALNAAEGSDGLVSIPTEVIFALTIINLDNT